MGVGAWAGTEGTLNDTDTADTDTGLYLTNVTRYYVWSDTRVRQYPVLDWIGDAEIAAQ